MLVVQPKIFSRYSKVNGAIAWEEVTLSANILNLSFWYGDCTIPPMQ